MSQALNLIYLDSCVCGCSTNLGSSLSYLSVIINTYIVLNRSRTESNNRQHVWDEAIFWLDGELVDILGDSSLCY